MPNSPGGTKQRRRNRIDILFGTVFVLAAGRFVVQSLIQGNPMPSTLADSRFWLVGGIGVLFFSSLKTHRLRAVQPFVFLLAAMIPFSQTTETAFGFGLFAVGAIMLYSDGHLESHSLSKLVTLGIYFLGLILMSAVVSTANWEQVMVLFVFMAVFFLYLFLTFQEKIVVFVKAEKPTVRLSDRGLPEKEIAYLLPLLEGKTVKEIAWTEGVSVSTVRNSLSRSYRKLGVADMAQLLQWAQNHNVRS